MPSSPADAVGPDLRAYVSVVTGAFLNDLAAADPVARCTRVEWTVTDLAAHLGGVHRWAAHNLGSLTRGDLEDRPEIDTSPLEWYAGGRDELLGALQTIDPDAECYTLSRTDRTARFWHRRQLHETLVHLWDLRSASDPNAPAPLEVPPSIHADGVVELFETFVARARGLEPLGGVVRLVATDTGDAWTFGPDWERDAGSAPDATITGTAGDLLLYVWNRADHVDRSGDSRLIERFEQASLRP